MLRNHPCVLSDSYIVVASANSAVTMSESMAAFRPLMHRRAGAYAGGGVVVLRLHAHTYTCQKNDSFSFAIGLFILFSG